MTTTRTALVKGAGIAGPVAAMALRKAGIQPTVHEAHPGSAEGIGTFLTIASNGIDALRAIGAQQPVLAAGFPTPAIMLRSTTGKSLGGARTGLTLPDGTTSHTLKRADLYQALYQEAARRGIHVQHGKRLTAAEQTSDGVRAVFEDGSDAVADVLIGADGIHSTVRKLIDPAAPAPTYIGLINLGGYTRSAEVDAEPGSYTMTFGKRAFFGYVLAPSGEVWWFANVPHPDKPARGEAEAITPAQWQHTLAGLFAADTGPAARLVNATATADIMKAGPIHSIPHLPAWHNDRMIVIGDAASGPVRRSGRLTRISSSWQAEHRGCLCGVARHIPLQPSPHQGHSLKTWELVDDWVKLPQPLAERRPSKQEAERLTMFPRPEQIDTGWPPDCCEQPPRPRLVLPVLMLRLGFDWRTLRLASTVALMPTWFLAAYIVVTATAPATLWLWERWRWGSVAAGVVLAAAVDAGSLASGSALAGFVNYWLVWGTVHQFGFAWLDGELAAWWQRLLLCLTGLTGALVLVRAGPYPVSMVGVDTSTVTNTYPPRVTLLFLGMFQSGLLLLFAGPAQRALRHLHTWTVVVALNLRIMTLYLWHVTAMVMVIAVSVASGGAGLGLTPLTWPWWVTRPVWYLLLGAVTIALIALFGRFETPAPDSRPAPPWWRPLLAVAGVCGGLGGMAIAGVIGAHGLNWGLLLVPVLSVYLGGVAHPPRLGRHRPRMA